jgi:hypothetical protein
MNRRNFLKGILAGGAVVAGELWIPGQKLISIPSGKRFGGVVFQTLGGEDKIVVPPREGGYTVAELYDAVCKLMDKSEMMPFAQPLLPDTPNLYSLTDGYEITEDSFKNIRGGTIYERETGNYWTDYMQIGERCLKGPDVALALALDGVFT